jgi:hypothetical protein
MDAYATALQMFNRRTVLGIGILSLAQQGARPRLYAKRPFRARRVRSLLKLSKGGRSLLLSATPDTSLDQFEQRESEYPDVVILASPLGAR